MVLHHVPDRADLVVEGAAALHAERLRHGDLHARDEVAVPERLEERIREAEEHHVLHRPLPEIVVDAEDAILAEGREQDLVERLRRGEAAPERFLHDDPRARGTAGVRDLLHHDTEDRGWNREVVRRPLGRAELPADRLERRRVVVVAVHVAQQARQFLEGGRVEPAVLLDRLARPRLQLVEVPPGARDADHRHVEEPAFDHRLQGRIELLVGEIACRAEEDECVGCWFAHRGLAMSNVICPAGFSWWPPNWWRIAESSLSAKSASPRELNRS